MAATVALIVAIVGIPTSIALAAAPFVAPVIQARLARNTKTPPVIQGQPVADNFADDAIEAWRGRAMDAESRLARADERIAALEHRLSLIESQARD